jgi:alpha-L-rhamnosidase
VVVQIPAPPAPLLRTDFTVAGRVARARLYASSPGYGELSVNGRRTDDAVLDPAWTRYDRRVQYVTRDVTRLLKPGANVLGAVLGRGFYGLTTRNVWDHDRAPWHGDPRLRAQLRVEYTDGRLQTVATDGTWRTTDSPTVSDSIYAGETYDARRAIRGWDTAAVSAAGWQPARVVPAPTATVDAQEHEPIRIVRTHRATTIDNPRPGTYVFRFPVTLAGWARLRVTGPAGTQVTLRYGEKLRADGTVNNDNEYVTGDHQVDRYVLRGGAAETWEPRFSYKGFTYVQVDGYPGRPTAASVQARELHTDVPSIGDFTSSNPLLNTIHKMTRQSILNNLHGLPTDTPMYEKNGWLGDALMTNGAASYNFGMQRIYRKWLDDVRDSIFPDGLVPVIAPTGGWGRWNSVEWGAAYPLILWSCYLHYGDRELLAEHYEAVRRYADYLNGKAKPDGTHDSTLGDWVPPGFHGNPPEGAAQSATAFVALVHATVADMARALDRPADVTRYTDLASSTRTALNTRFLDADRGVYSTDRPVGYRQTPNILPPAFGLSPAGAVTDKVIANLVADIHAKGDHLDTGILGTRYLFALLTAHGHGELAYRVATQTTYPSWGYWIGKGATTLWEMWDEGSRSLDHHMFGSIDQWFVEDLAGLRPTEPGYAAVRVAPHPLGDLTSASARVATVRGDVAVSWRKAAGVLSINVTVPVGATATVVLPGVTGWRVDGGYGGVAGAPGVQSVHQEDATQVVTIGSGTYRFRGSA